MLQAEAALLATVRSDVQHRWTKFTTRHATWQIHSLLMRDDSSPTPAAVTGGSGARCAAGAAAPSDAPAQPLVCTTDDPAQAVEAVEAAVAASRARHTDASTPAPKPDVILVHGHSAGSALWEAVLDRLAPLANLHVLDMPGWGRSPLPPQLEGETRPERIAELHVEMLVGWMTAVGLAGGDASSSSSSSSSSSVDRRPILVGHSFGGFHSVQLASRHPHLISQLILVAPAGLTPMVPSGGVVWGFLFRYMPPQRISRIFGRLGFLVYKTLALALIKEDARLPDYYYQLAAQTAATGCGDVVASRFFALNWSPRALLAGHGGAVGRAIAKLLPAPRPRHRAAFAAPSSSAAGAGAGTATSADPALDAINDAAAAAAAGSASLGMQFWWRLPMLTRLMNLPASLPVCIVFGQADDLLHPIFAPLLHRIRPATDCYLVRHALHNPAHNAPHAFCDAVADAIIKVRSRGAARAVVLAPGEAGRYADGTADVLLDARCPPSRVLRVDYSGAAIAGAAATSAEAAEAGQVQGQGANAAAAVASAVPSTGGSPAEVAAADADEGADADADGDAEADVCCSGSVDSTGSSSMQSGSTLVEGEHEGEERGSGGLRCRSQGGWASSAARSDSGNGSGRLTVAVPPVGERAGPAALLSSFSTGSAASNSSSTCSSVCSSSASSTTSSSCLSSEIVESPSPSPSPSAASTAAGAAAAPASGGRTLAPLRIASLDGDAAAGAARRRHSHSVEHGDHSHPHHHHHHHHHHGLHMEAVVDAPAFGAGPSTGRLHLMEPATPGTFARVSAAAAAAMGAGTAKTGRTIAANGSDAGASGLAAPTLLRRLALAGGAASALNKEATAASGSSPVLLGARRASAGSAADAHVVPQTSSACAATSSLGGAASAGATAAAESNSDSSGSGFGFGRGFCHGCFRPVELHKSYWRCACAAWSSNTWGDANATAAHFAALVAFLDELYVTGTFNARTSTAIPLYLAVRTPLPPPAAPGSGLATPTASSAGSSGAATPARAPWRRPGAQPVPLSEHTGLPGFKPLPAPFQRGEALLLD